MQRVGLKEFSLFMMIAILGFYESESFAAGKDADELEEALMVKLLERRAKKRGDDDEAPEKQKRIEKADLKILKVDDKSEISMVVVNDIKNITKGACLDFLASSELISWSELRDRLDRAKRALEMFEVKYKPQLISDGKAPLVQSAVYPPVKTNTMPSALPPGVNPVMPGITIQPPVSSMMPGLVQSQPAKKVDDDEEEEDETPAKQPAPLFMPGIGMPGLKPMSPPVFNQAPGLAPLGQQGGGAPMTPPVGMPGAKVLGMPTSFPGSVPQPATTQAPQAAPSFAGGMPMAR